VGLQSPVGSQVKKKAFQFSGWLVYEGAGLVIYRLD
jgi:hypothetical protein